MRGQSEKDLPAAGDVEGREGKTKQQTPAHERPEDLAHPVAVSKSYGLADHRLTGVCKAIGPKGDQHLQLHQQVVPRQRSAPQLAAQGREVRDLGAKSLYSPHVRLCE